MELLPSGKYGIKEVRSEDFCVTTTAMEEDERLSMYEKRGDAKGFGIGVGHLACVLLSYKSCRLPQ